LDALFIQKSAIFQAMIVFYLILRLMVRVALRIFYKEFSVHGRERLPTKGPLIVVANHPNTLMDPLVVASLLHQQAGFIGSGMFFRNKWLAALLRYFQVIPVYRKQDIRPGESIDNQDNFQHAREYLGKNGTLLMFPEGTSYPEKKLRDLRTGAARIALTFEEAHDFQAGLLIVPLAMNYSASTRFRTRMRIDIGTPIAVRDFAALYASDEVEAVKALTETVRVQIAERMVILDDKDQERMHNQIARLQREHFHPRQGLPALRAEQELADRIRDVQQTDPTAMAQLQLHLDQWFAMLDRLQISEGFFKSRFRKWPAGLLWALQLMVLLVGAPLYVFGLLTNWFPYWLPGWAALRISDEVEYHAPTMLVIGIFLFPLWYALLVLTLWLLGLGGWWLLAFGLMLPIAGAFAMWYGQQMERFDGLGSLLLIQGRKRSLIDRLDDARIALLAEIDETLATIA
jgi:glycerol-3-phosphate O-acyltransferase / dihydroxyacetone phosphate acyltransferase